MKLIAGVIVAVLGILVAALSLAGVVPGLTQTGILTVILGLLIVGMSFIRSVPAYEDGAEEMSTPSTLVNIFFAPAETFQSLRRRPRWLAAAIIMTLLSVTYSNLFLERLTVERVANYQIDKTLEMGFLNDEARNQIESGRAQAIADAKNPVKRAAGLITSFFGQIAGYALLALLFFLVVLAFGGSIYYWQAFSVAIYAAFPVAVLRFILNTLVLYLKDPVEIHPILGQSTLIQDNLGFLVSPGDNPVLYTILASLSLLAFYWVFLNATGLKNGGDKVSSSTGWSAALIAFGILFLFGLTMAVAFPQFIS
jgi:hypothetical protein